VVLEAIGDKFGEYLVLHAVRRLAARKHVEQDVVHQVRVCLFIKADDCLLKRHQVNNAFAVVVLAFQSVLKCLLYPPKSVNDLLLHRFFRHLYRFAALCLGWSVQFVVANKVAKNCDDLRLSGLCVLVVNDLDLVERLDQVTSK
jgi:hypothetical protein